MKFPLSKAAEIVTLTTAVTNMGLMVYQTVHSARQEAKRQEKIEELKKKEKRQIGFVRF